ncbi:hypothetical protein C8F04DRAFT_1175834 [Mycena alexandri]|uniref:Uncharacterized protein n=1 Tax=Mycena alexandri TaxID=1745969 RepID=A0AAD6XEV5_9AGAR|nr:hypothetical protein C8F04DRAFT_1175834 [Mycena alexandri]
MGDQYRAKISELAVNTATEKLGRAALALTAGTSKQAKGLTILCFLPEVMQIAQSVAARHNLAARLCFADVVAGGPNRTKTGGVGQNARSKPDKIFEIEHKSQLTFWAQIASTGLY